MIKDLFKKYQELDTAIGEMEMYIKPIKTLANELSQQHFGDKW